MFIDISTLEIIPTPKSVRPYPTNPEQYKENETNERELKNISTTSDSSRKNWWSQTCKNDKTAEWSSKKGAAEADRRRKHSAFTNH